MAVEEAERAVGGEHSEAVAGIVKAHGAHGGGECECAYYGSALGHDDVDCVAMGCGDMFAGGVGGEQGGCTGECDGGARFECACVVEAECAAVGNGELAGIGGIGDGVG